MQKIDLARIRTWNLLIRSQTRYPLRHKALHDETGDAKVFVMEHHPQYKMKNLHLNFPFENKTRHRRGSNP